MNMHRQEAEHQTCPLLSWVDLDHWMTYVNKFRDHTNQARVDNHQDPTIQNSPGY